MNGIGTMAIFKDYIRGFNIFYVNNLHFWVMYLFLFSASGLLYQLLHIHVLGKTLVKNIIKENTLLEVPQADLNGQASGDNAINFQDFKSRRTQTYHMVCLKYKKYKGEISRPARKSREPFWYIGKNRRYSMPHRSCAISSKKIRIYQDSYPSGKLPKFRRMDVSFHPANKRPKYYKVINNQTAYFVTYDSVFEPTNFFHFTRQIYFPLYWMIKSTNQLHDEAHNIVFYPKPYALCINGEYHPVDINLYQTFRDVLFIKNRDKLSAFNDRKPPHRVCYKNAVFTSEWFLDKAHMAIEYFKQKIGVGDSSCSAERRTLTIIDRKSYRRIVNVEQLQDVGEQLGFNTQIVYLETLSLKKQCELMHCTDVLVGLVGAGLQWAFFMQNNSGVVEIAWPQHGWPFFFTGSGDYQSMERSVIRPLNFIQLSNVTCRLNPNAPSILQRDLWKLNSTIPPVVAMKILKDPRNYDQLKKPSHTAAKLCDIEVNLDAFKTAVIAASTKLDNNG